MNKVEIRKWGNRYGIVNSSGEWFMNEKNRERLYTRPGSAVAFLRRTGLAWIVKTLSGKTLFVNCINPALLDKFDPHKWIKKNLVTLEDPKGGFYDLWRCELCCKEVKHYGLSGRPQAGTCEKNPVDAASGE